LQYTIILINDNKKELTNLIEYFQKIRDLHLKIVSTKVEFETYIHTHDIHLILANEHCIEIDPLSLCQHIRSLNELNFLPFLYLTTTDDIKNIQNAYDIGVNECVKAPIHLDELLPRIYRYILNYDALKKCLGQNERLAVVLATDQLTKVSNRMHLQTLLSQAIKEYKRYDRSFSLIYFRIQDMQKINAIFGFAKGDKLLKDIAQFVAKNIRASDVIARWGGGDFVILAPNTIAKDAHILTKKLDKALKEKSFLPSFSIQIYFGITEVLKEDTIYTITDRAKKALHVSSQNRTLNIVTL